MDDVVIVAALRTGVGKFGGVIAGGQESMSLAPHALNGARDGLLSPGINDDAVAEMMMSATKAKALGLRALARIKAYSSAGVDPSIMGVGPIPASKLCIGGGMGVALAIERE